MRITEPLLKDFFPRRDFRLVDPNTEYIPKENEEVSWLFYDDEPILQMVSVRETKKQPCDPFSGQKTH